MDLLDRIFEGCFEEFRLSGLKFTMDSLAKRVGISKRTLYETLPSKKAVIELVIDRVFENVKEQQKEILNQKDLSTVEKVQKLLRVVPAYTSVVDFRRMNEIRLAYPDLYKKVQNKLESDWEATLTLLEQAMEEGTMRKTNLTIVRLLLSSIYEQLINGEQLIKNNISYESAMSEMISIICEGLLIRS